jgi:hypothetical protein
MAQSLQYALYVTLLSQICNSRGDPVEAAAYDELLEEHRSQRKGNDQKWVAQDSGAAQEIEIHNQRAHKPAGVALGYVRGESIDVQESKKLVGQYNG